MKFKSLLYIALFLFPSLDYAGNIYSRKTGNWSDATVGNGTWSTVAVSGASCDCIPGAGDNVFIGRTGGGSYTITVDGAYTCNDLTLGTSSNDMTITISGANSLTINGDLKINPSDANKNFTLNAVDGTIDINGTFSAWGATNGGSIQVTSGIINFTPAVSLANDADQDITFNGAGTINFFAGFTDNGAGAFTTFAGCTVNFGGSYTNINVAQIWDPSSNAVFNGGVPTITPTAAITFGNFTISGVTVTLAGNITVAGNWTNNAGALTGGVNSVTFGDDLATRTGNIGGTTATAFPNLSINDDAVYTLMGALTYSCTNLTFLAGNAASSLTHNGSNPTLNVTGGSVTINQPTANTLTKVWNINGGASTITTNLIFSGTNNTVDRVSKVNVTTGSLTVSGAVNWMANTAVPTEVISLGTGIITLSNSLTMADGSGTLNVSGAGILNFYGAAPPSFSFNQASGGIDPVFTTSSGCTLNFAAGFTNLEDALVIANGSYSIFTGSGNITPTAAITFGNIQINAAPVVTLVGSISVTNDWTNLGGTFTPGTNTVTFNGTGIQTITKAGGETFYTITTSTTGPLTLGSDVMVTNTLNMNGGNYDLGGFILTLGNSADATLTRTAGIMYNGYFKRWFPNAVAISSTAAPLRGLFPVGTSSDYSPVEINSTSNPTVPGYVTAQHIDALTVTDVGYTDNEGDVIQRIHNSKAILATSGFAGDAGAYNLYVTFTILSSLGNLTDMKLETYTGGAMGSVGCQTTCGPPLITGGSVPAPIVRRGSLSSGQFANDWVLATKDKGATPLRAVYYSRVSGNWDDMVSVWSLTDGGGACSCSPTSITDGYAIINSGTTVTVTATDAVDFIDVKNGGILNGTAGNFTVNMDLTTFGNGAFTPSAGTWVVSRNVLLSGTGTSNTPGGSAMNITGNLTISSGTSLCLGAQLTISGNLTVDGSICLSGNNLILNGTGKTISNSTSANITTSSGAPTITLTNNKTINSGTVLTIGTVAFPITLALSTATTITSNGTISLNGSMTGAAATSVWTHNADAVLNITDALLATGTLNASTSPNTVNYSGGGAQSIKVPASSYYNLNCSNAGVKSLTADVSVTNMVTIQDAAILDEAATGNDLTGAGGLTMTIGTPELIVRDATAANTLPMLTPGVYTLTAGTVTITSTAGGAGNPVRGATYYNLNLNGTANCPLNDVTSITNNFTVSNTVDITSNGVLTVGGAITYSSTDADGWTLTNNITAGSLTMTAVNAQINAGTYSITISGSGWTNNSTDAVNFDAGTGTVFFTGGVAQTIGGTATPVAFYNLTISNTSGNVSLNSSQNVTTFLEFTSGRIILGTNNLIVGVAGSSAGSIIGENSSTSIVTNSTGYLQRYCPVSTQVEFPVLEDEAGTYRYLPAFLTTQAGATAGNYRVRVADGPSTGSPAQPTQCVDAEWTIDRASGAGNLTVKVQWPGDAGDLSGGVPAQENINWNDASYVTLGRYNGSVWIEEENGATVFVDGVPSTASATFSSFSPFAVGSGTAPLPIGLLTFTAEYKDSAVQLKWSTSTEKNNDYFNIERSKDGTSFNTIAKIQSKGNSNDRNDYFYTDETPLEGISYYRLKQTDNDGKFTFSEIESVFIPLKGIEVRKIFPNPAGNNAFIDVFSPEDKFVEVRITNIYGLTLKTFPVNLTKGDNLISMDLSDVGGGVFFINFSNLPEKIQPIKLMID